MIKRSTTKEFIKKANKIHNDKYDYSSVAYVNWRTDVKIACKIHGNFFQIPNNHLKGEGCPECRYEKSAMLYKSNETEFIKKAKKYMEINTTILS